MKKLDELIRQKILQNGPNFYLYFWSIHSEIDYERYMIRFYCKITTTIAQTNNLEPYSKEAKKLNYIESLSDKLFGRVRQLSD